MATAKASQPKQLKPAPPKLHIVRPPEEGESAERIIPISAIKPCPYQPRRHFDPQALQRLGESLKARQLQPVVVRPVSAPVFGGGKREVVLRYELIAGERRWRAAQLVGLPGIRATIVLCTDAQACEWAGVENYEREQFNAIEEAHWFKSMIDVGGYTQQKLAERLGITQGQVSNRLRLLQLPRVFQERVISGEMPATWARHLAAWADRPTVMHALSQDTVKPQNEGHLVRLIESAVSDCTRPISGMYCDAKHVWHDVAFKPTPAQIKELDTIEVKSWRGKEKRACNLALWDKLQAEAQARKSEREARRAEFIGSSGDGRGNKVAAAQARERAKEQAQQFAKRLYRWKIAWLQSLLMDKLTASPDADAMILRLLMHFTMQRTDQRDAREMRKAITDAGGHVKASNHYCHTVRTIPSLLTVPPGKLRGAVMHLLRTWLTMPTDACGAHLRPEDIEALADALGIVVKRDWKLTEEYLQLHTTAQLLALCKEWALPMLHGVAPAKLKRADIIKGILERGPKACPREVLNVRRRK